MSTPKHSVSVAGIVVDEHGRILLVQRRDNGHWEPPGGVLELDETFEQGVQREVEEETGLVVTVERISGVYKNVRLGIVALVFRCKPEKGDIRTSCETVNIAWVTIEEASQLMDQAYFVRVRDAFSAIVHVRAHDGVRVV